MENIKNIGKYDKSVKGRKAVLKQEIAFHTECHSTTSKNKKHFPIGTTITAVHEVMGTGLTTFNFNYNGKIYQHVVREGKFEYIN
jgi:hypothetical protein